MEKIDNHIEWNISDLKEFVALMSTKRTRMHEDVEIINKLLSDIKFGCSKNKPHPFIIHVGFNIIVDMLKKSSLYNVINALKSLDGEVIFRSDEDRDK